MIILTSILPLFYWAKAAGTSPRTGTEALRIFPATLHDRRPGLTIKAQSTSKVKLHHTATGNHMPYGITQCYLPDSSDDFTAFPPAEAGTRFSDPRGMQGWVDLSGRYSSQDSLPAADGHMSQK